MKKHFTYKYDWHYLFSDGVVRKKIASPSGHDQGFLFIDNGVRRTVYCANDGIPHGALVPTPHIVMCLEDPTTWDWQFVGKNDTYFLICRFTFEKSEFKVEQTRPFVDNFIVVVDGDLVDGGSNLSMIAKTLGYTPSGSYQEFKSTKLDKLKADYAELMDKAKQILKQIERLEI